MPKLIVIILVIIIVILCMSKSENEPIVEIEHEQLTTGGGIIFPTGETY